MQLSVVLKYLGIYPNMSKMQNGLENGLTNTLAYIGLGLDF